MQDPVDVWSGEFGDAYTQRNALSKDALRQRVRMWARVLSGFGDQMPESILEVGCNVGLNLHALSVLTGATLWAVEPNASARSILAESRLLDASHIKAGRGESLPFDDASVDLVFTSGVLIHVHPDNLPTVADEMYRVSKRYIFVNEYFSAEPEKKQYRERSDLLFKRDFAGFFLDRFQNLKVVDDGFFWKRTTNIDNSTWAILEKNLAF